MNSRDIALIILLLASGLRAQTIAPGASGVFILEHPVNTRSAQAGDYVLMQTAAPIHSADGRVVVPEGSFAQGRIVIANRAAAGRKSGELQIEVVKIVHNDSVLAVSGKSILFKALSGKRRSVARRGAEYLGASFVGWMVGAAATESIEGGRAGMAISGLGLAFAGEALPKGREVELQRGASIHVLFE